MVEVVVALVVGVVVVIFFSLLLTVRTLRLRSDQVYVQPDAPLDLDIDAAAERLSRAITYKTVSHQDTSLFRGEEFLGLHEHLARAFPRVHARLERESVGDYSLLYTWKGKDPEAAPVMLMAHMDVVPVEEETLVSWTHPPFEGRIADGCVWGRGALDDKLGVMGVLEAVEGLLKAGMEPTRDVYIGFGHDEEIGGGNGAQNTARLLEERGVQLDFVLDEGGFVSDGSAFGSGNPVALVGVAEKGYLSVELTVEGSGGHSSMPPERTAIGLLSAAIDRLEKNRPAAKVDGPVRRMLENLAPELSFARRVAIANLWAFERLVVWQLSRFPVADSLIRTTTAPTMVSGGVKENILPAQARGTVNFRIRPGESIETVLEHVKETVRDPRIRVAPVPSALTFEPSEGSCPDSENYGIVHRTIRQAFPDVRVVPYLVVGATDSRYFNGLTRDVLKFVPIRMDPPTIKTVHGVNERVSLDQYADAIRFYAQLLVNAADQK